jgi:hypothetical protein
VNVAEQTGSDLNIRHWRLDFREGDGAICATLSFGSLNRSGFCLFCSPHSNEKLLFNTDAINDPRL